MAQAVREFVADFPRYRAAARAYAADWSTRHNPRQLVTQLCVQAAARAKTPDDRAIA
jgi:hypothetical protein